MPLQPINLGAEADDGTGDDLRTGGGKINAMFAELYAALGLNDAWKEPVRAATTEAIDLATDLEPGDSIDDVVLAEGDRVLVKDQVDPIANGIYVVPAAGAASRAEDLDEDGEFPAAAVLVREGTDNGVRLFLADAGSAFVVGTDELAFTPFSAAAAGGIYVTPIQWDYNFTGPGEFFIRAASEMVIAVAGVTNPGNGTLAYETSTAADPDTFAPQASPFTLEQGAKLKGIATDVTGQIVAHLAVLSIDGHAVGYQEAPFGPPYIVSFFFTDTPTANELLLMHVAGAGFTLAADFAGLQVSVGVNPAAPVAIDVQRNGVSIGTITIAGTGEVTAETVDNAAQTFEEGDVLTAVAPVAPDGTIAKVAVSMKGER